MTTVRVSIILIGAEPRVPEVWDTLEWDADLVASEQGGARPLFIKMVADSIQLMAAALQERHRKRGMIHDRDQSMKEVEREVQGDPRQF